MKYDRVYLTNGQWTYFCVLTPSRIFVLDSDESRLSLFFLLSRPSSVTTSICGILNKCCKATRIRHSTTVRAFFLFCAGCFCLSNIRVFTVLPLIISQIRWPNGAHYFLDVWMRCVFHCGALRTCPFHISPHMSGWYRNVVAICMYVCVWISVRMIVVVCSS